MKSIENRLLFNKAIIDKLQSLIKQYPEQRFGQLLINCGILSLRYRDGDKEYIIEDCFNEESEVTWKRMCKNKKQ